MKAITVAILSCFLMLSACGDLPAAPSSPLTFVGEWDARGSDWFSANSSSGAPAAREEVITDPRLTAQPLEVEAAAFNTSADPAGESTLGSSWVIPSLGKRSIGLAEDGSLEIFFGDCRIPAELEGNVARVRFGYACQMKVGDGTVGRTFTSGTLTLQDGELTFTAGGVFGELRDGQMFIGSFAINETLTR